MHSRSGTARHSWLATLAFALLAGAALGACATAPSTLAARSQPDDALIASLTDGNAVLLQLHAFSGYTEAGNEAWSITEMRGLYDTRAWRQLALTVLRIGAGSDLSWFYLGRAAEELGAPAAARKYYQRSVEATTHPGVSACLWNACSGFRFPQDSLARLRALEQELATDHPATTEIKN